MPSPGAAARLLALLTALLGLSALTLASPADAADDPPWIEASLGTWTPAPAIRLSADADGIVGSEINLRTELQLPRRPQWDVRVNLQPVRRHGFTVEYLPLMASATSVLARHVTFVGATYRSGQPVDASLAWHTVRAGYRYTLLARETWSLGLNVDLWHSDLRLRLQSGSTDREGKSTLPIPGIGTSLRWNVSPRAWISAEGSMFVIPDKPDHHFGGRYVNASGSAAWRLTPRLAAQAGVRVIDMRHLGKVNTGFGRITALYAGVVVSSK